LQLLDMTSNTGVAQNTLDTDWEVTTTVIIFPLLFIILYSLYPRKHLAYPRDMQLRIVIICYRS